MAETGRHSPDKVASPERLHSASETIGLQARLMLGGSALNADNSSVEAVDLSHFGKKDTVQETVINHSYDPYERASTKEREELAGVEKTKLNGAIDAWATKAKAWTEGIVEYTNRKATVEGDRLRQSINNIVADGREVQLEDFKQFYQVYLQGEATQSNIKNYVMHVVSQYVTQRDGKQAINLSKLNRDRELIFKFSHVFGTKSATMIMALIDAEVAIFEDSQNFINKVNEKGGSGMRINSLDPSKERPTLEFIWKYGQPIEEKNQASENVTQEPVIGPDEEKLTEAQGNSTAEKLLSQPVTFENNPAIRVLANQLQKANEHLIAQGINNPLEKARTLARLTSIDRNRLYQKIAEQSMFGPEPFERSERFEDINIYLPEIEEGLKKIEERAKTLNYEATDENGWMHYHSPSYDKTSYRHDYRIYLNPNAQNYIHVVNRLLEYGKDHPLYFKITAHDLLRLDKIVLYLSKDNIDQVMEIVLDIAKDPEKPFDKRLPPGGGQVVLDDGISLTRQSKKRYGTGPRKTGTEINAAEIETKMEKAFISKFLDGLNKHPSLGEFFYSDELKLYAPLVLDNYKISLKSLHGPGFLDSFKTDPDYQNLLAQAFILAGYESPRSLQQKEDPPRPNSYSYEVDMPAFKHFLRELVIRLNNSSLAQEIENLSQDEFNRTFRDFKTFSDFLIRDMSLALQFYEILKNGEPPEEIYRKLYEHTA